MNFKSMLLSTVFLLLACSQPTAPATLPPARSVVSVTVNGTPRSYILRFPKAYDGKTKLPMVMLLHGATDSAEYAEQAYHVDTKAEAEGYVLVIPDALGASHAWSSYGDSDATKDDEAFLVGLLTELPKTYAIDTRRVYVAGHSAGSMMTYRLAVDHPELIAAEGIVAGAINGFTPPKGPMPIVAFHGKLDEILPYEDLIESLAFWVEPNHCDAKPTKFEEVKKGVTRATFTPTDKAGAEIVAYSLDDGNHMWPGGVAMPGKTMIPVQDISATDIMFAFFKRHVKP